MKTCLLLGNLHIFGDYFSLWKKGIFRIFRWKLLFHYPFFRLFAWQSWIGSAFASRDFFTKLNSHVLSNLSKTFFRRSFSPYFKMVENLKNCRVLGSWQILDGHLAWRSLLTRSKHNEQGSNQRTFLDLNSKTCRKGTTIFNKYYLKYFK